MLTQLKKLKQERADQGFTIIEVMIVLAIAGLILLIVFLAIPALQRNSRNTQRKNDVAALLAAYTEFENNNQSSLPTGAWTSANGQVTLVGPANTTSSQAAVGYYNVGVNATNNGDVDPVAAGTTTGAGQLAAANTDYVKIASGTSCAAGGVSVAGPSKSVTAVYEIESGSNTYAQQCQAS